MPRLRFLSLIILALWIITACTPVPETALPPANAHTPAELPPPNAQTEDKIPTSPVWTTPLSGAVNTNPFLSGPLVIIPTADGVIHAVNAATGIPAWTFSPATKVWDASVNGDDTRVCAGMAGGQFTCLDAATGHPLWIADLGAEVQSRVALIPDRVYAPSTWAGAGLENNFTGQASLFALDAATGNIVWEAVTNNYILRRPVVTEEFILTGGAYQISADDPEKIGTRIFALHAADGSVAWTHESDDGLVRWLETAGDTALFSAASETVYGLNLSTGEQRWLFGPSYWMQFPAIQGDMLFFGSGDQFFQALDAATGKIIWTHEINMDALNQIGRPLIEGDHIWFNAVTGEIYGVDLATGTRIAYLFTGHSSRVGGALYQNLYILGDPDGNLYAYAMR